MAVLENDVGGPTSVGLVLVAGEPRPTGNTFFDEVKKRAEAEGHAVKSKHPYHDVHATVAADQERTAQEREAAYGEHWKEYAAVRMFGHTAIITRIKGQVHEVWGFGPVSMDKIPGPGMFRRNDPMIKDPRAISFEVGLPSIGNPMIDKDAEANAKHSEQLVRAVCLAAANTKATYNFTDIDIKQGVGNCIAVGLDVIKRVFAEWPIGIAARFEELERDVQREVSDLTNFNQRALAYRVMLGSGQFFKK